MHEERPNQYQWVNSGARRKTQPIPVGELRCTKKDPTKTNGWTQVHEERPNQDQWVNSGARRKTQPKPVGELRCARRVSRSRSFKKLIVLLIYIVKSGKVLSMIEERKHYRWKGKDSLLFENGYFLAVNQILMIILNGFGSDDFNLGSIL